MFLVAQLIGVYVANTYLPQDNIPYGLEPPQDVDPGTSIISIVIALGIAISLIFILMKIRAELFLRLWFLFVIIVGIALALNAIFINFPYSSIIALILALPLAISKVFQRNMLVHNVTELLIYPGIASVFIPILNIWSAVLLLIIISIYDIYAVWHSGFMQKMAQYQMEQVKVFAGFFVPFMGKKEKEMIRKAKIAKKAGKPVKDKKLGINVAILGGGDVVFPIILAGVVLATFGPAAAMLISLGATVALAFLFYFSKKGKFYPAMPFITTGCLVALGIVYLVY